MSWLRNIRFLTYAILMVSAVIAYVSWKRSASAAELKSQSIACGLVVTGTDPKPLARLLEKADHVILKGENEKEGRSEADRDWIQRISHQISLLKLGEPNSCLCCGWMTAYFYEKDCLLASVAPIHGNQVRIDSKICAGDFEISEDSWRAFETIFKEKTRANQLLQGKPGKAPSSSPEPETRRP